MIPVLGAVVLAVALRPVPDRPPVAELVGKATYYAYRPGQAAAGPALRAFLGPHWRGQTVRVCSARRCVLARLTDYMGTHNRAKVIDLDVGLFAALALPSRGVISVTVRGVD